MLKRSIRNGSQYEETMAHSLAKVYFLLFGLVLPAVFAQAPATDVADAGALTVSISGLRNRSAVDCAGQYNRMCADCRNFAVCAGDSAPISIQSCSSVNPAAPYCVNGACSSAMESDNTICSAEYRCSSVGYFPHPDDCSKYYFCDEVNGVAYEYSCGENRVYLSRQKSCANRTAETGCDTINCRDHTNTFVRYSSHPSYYAFCAESAGRKETIMFKCPDEDTSEFDLETLSCMYRCPGEGRFYNPSSCRTFYECYRYGTTYNAIKWKCPEGYYYDATYQLCIPGLKCPEQNSPLKF